MGFGEKLCFGNGNVCVFFFFLVGGNVSTKTGWDLGKNCAMDMGVFLGW